MNGSLNLRNEIDQCYVSIKFLFVQNCTEYQDAFEIYDRDGNGFITTRELKSLLRCLGSNPTDAELQQIVNEVDADGKFTKLGKCFALKNTYTR